MLGKWSEALEHYAQALKIEPENRTLRQRHAFALAAVGRTDEALELFRKLKDEYPGDYIFDLDIGQIYERTGQIARACAVLKEASQRHPCADTYHAYALILGKAGQFGEAVRSMRAYLSVAPEKDGVRKTRALALIADWEKKITPAAVGGPCQLPHE
jgi:tetratricopeptide (TPR) repeat protein